MKLARTRAFLAIIPWACVARSVAAVVVSSLSSFTPSSLAEAEIIFFAAALSRLSMAFSNVIGVAVALPSTSTVTVHSKRNGSPSGLMYRIVTAPVSASFESA